MLCSSVQAKHQPLQFLNVSTLREYLRFEFQDLVGPAVKGLHASVSSAHDPWHQQQQEQDGDQSGPAENGVADDASVDENETAVPYIPEVTNGQFDFERVLQDFVLLTFLVSS